MSKPARTPRLLGALPSLLALGLVISIAMLGVVHGMWSKTLEINGSVTTGNTNATFIEAETNDAGVSNDPGYPTHVASCGAKLQDEGRAIAVTITNAFPSYSCTLRATMQAGGSVPERIEPAEINAPPEVSVVEIGDLSGTILTKGELDIETFRIHVEPQAEQKAKYEFTIKKEFSVFSAHTIGFWKNWFRHNTYSAKQIQDWLKEIDAYSSWYGPTSIIGMHTVLAGAGGPGADPESRFLAQCLATNLNFVSEWLDGPHDVTSVDPGNYLGLASPSSATLAQIIAAIESKFGTSPTNTQFNIMKDVCDGLNNFNL